MIRILIYWRFGFNGRNSNFTVELDAITWVDSSRFPARRFLKTQPDLKLIHKSLSPTKWTVKQLTYKILSHNLQSFNSICFYFILFLQLTSNHKKTFFRKTTWRRLNLENARETIILMQLSCVANCIDSFPILCISMGQTWQNGFFYFIFLSNVSNVVNYRVKLLRWNCNRQFNFSFC